MLKGAIIGVMVCSTITATGQKAIKKREPSLSQRSRAAVLKDYRTSYLGTNLNNVGWTGDIKTCNPGTLAPATYAAVIGQINFFRRMAGFSLDCSIDTSLSSQLQQTALMMDANNALSHAPTPDWKCYTQEGARGAASSNLHLGGASGGAIEGFMSDDGANNNNTGHRRWLLYSMASTFGFGATSRAAALHVFGKPRKQPVPPFIAWPPAGYVPRTLIYDRWSFLITGGQFSHARVSMSGPDGAVPLTVVSDARYYSDAGVVWEPKGIMRRSDSDMVYTVTVSGVQAAADSVYRYKVIIIKP